MKSANPDTYLNFNHVYFNNISIDKNNLFYNKLHQQDVKKLCHINKLRNV